MSTVNGGGGEPPIFSTIYQGPLRIKVKAVCQGQFLNLLAIPDHLQAVGAHAAQIRKIPQTQKCMQVNRRNVIPAAEVTITTFFYTLI
jgi:hypothetical protein